METVLHIGLSNALVASALALVAIFVGRFYRRPALVHGLWLLVLLKLLTPPLVPITIPWPVQPDPQPVASAPPAVEPNETPLSDDVLFETAPQLEDSPRVVLLLAAEPAPTSETEPPPVAATVPPAPFPWQAVVAGVWLSGSVAWFLCAAWRVLRFRRLLHIAILAPDHVREATERLARKIRLPACPPVYLIPGQLAPMFWAVGGQPRLLLPKELLAHLTPEQLETLLAHELSHLRRRDHWVRGLEFLALGLYWWHPVVWYARRELREAEEQCCDAWVVSLLPGAGKTYATALLETLDFLSDARPAVPLLASGIGHVSDLKRRLTMILGGTTPRALTWTGTLAVLGLGLLALPLLPTLANAQSKEQQIELELKLAEKRLAEAAQHREAGNAQASQEALEHKLAILRKELAKLQDETHQRMAMIKELEAALAATKGGKATAEVPQNRILMLVNPGEGNKPPQHDILLRRVGDKWEIVQPGGKPDVQPFRIEQIERPGGDVIFRIAVPEPGKSAPLPPLPPAPPQVQDRKPTTRPAPEWRMDNLERQLQQIMKELESLRKEMKQPRTGAGVSTGQDKELAQKVAELQNEIKTRRTHAESLRAKAASLRGTEPSQAAAMIEQAESLEHEAAQIQHKLEAFKGAMEGR